MKFWKTVGKEHFSGVLLPLARAYLCIPATEVPSERVWSSAGFIYNETNAQMTNENVCKRVRVRDRALELKNEQQVNSFIETVKATIEDIKEVGEVRGIEDKCVDVFIVDRNEEMD